MLLYYIRHGDPIYDPDSLTPLGHRQAEAVAKRLSLYGVDRIFASTSTRAIQTAQPTCEMLKKDMELLDFCSEAHAWREMGTENEKGQYTWVFAIDWIRQLFAGNEIRQYGNRWFDHPAIKHLNLEKGITRVQQESDALFASLGYEHDLEKNMYKITRPNDDRIAIFAHQGFGMAFLSCVLDIPYPEFCTHFDMGHTGMTVIEFANSGEYCIPKALMVANDSHLYREGLPTNYGNMIRF